MAIPVEIPLIFKYTTEADHEVLNRLEEFLKGDYTVYEISSEPERPVWIHFSIELNDGKYHLMLCYNKKEKTEAIVEYTHDEIIVEAQLDDADYEGDVHNNINEIIICIINDYFY